MAITTMAAALAELPGQTLHIVKSTPGSSVGYMQSAWMSAGSPGAGAAPTALNGHLLTGATTGAIPFVNPTGGAITYLARANLRQSVTGTLAAATFVLYDRLWHNLPSATSTSAQAISPGALTRWTTGDAVELWWETFATTGAATPTITALYTDQDGNTGQSASSAPVASAMAAQRCGMFELAAGDTGVRAVTSWTNSVSFVNANSIGAVLRRRIATVVAPGTVQGFDSARDLLATKMASVPDDACLEILIQIGGTVVTTCAGTLQLVQG
jgi:hypothetical protein